MYVATMLGSPLFQILFFTYLGRYAGSQDDAFFIVGNAIQVAAMAGIYGMTMGIANERQYGTLQPLLATPANRLAIFSGRALPFIANGIAVSVFGFAVVVAPARLPARRGKRPGARRRGRHHDQLLRGARDADRLDRAPGARRVLRREPRLLPHAARLRRQRSRSTTCLAGSRRSDAACRSRTGSRRRARSPPGRRSATSPAFSGRRR